MPNLAIVFLVIFTLELVFLSFFSRLLTASLAQLFYRLTNSRETIVNILAVILWPGTLIHEFSHAITAGVLMVHVGDVVLTPETNGEHITLGKAEVGKTDPFRQLLIGVAPVFWGLAIIISSLWFFTLQGEALLWQLVLLLYLVFVIANTMFASKKDMEGSLIVFFILATVLFSFYLLKINQPFLFMESLMTPEFAGFMKKVDMFLGVPLGVDLLIYTLAQIILKKR